MYVKIIASQMWDVFFKTRCRVARASVICGQMKQHLKNVVSDVVQWLNDVDGRLHPGRDHVICGYEVVT